MSIDNAHTDGTSGGQAQIRRGLLREVSQPAAHRAHIASDALILQRVGKPDGGEVVAVPPTILAFVPQIGPLADGGAEAASGIAAGTIGEIVGEVEELARAAPGRWQALLEPFELG